MVTMDAKTVATQNNFVRGCSTSGRWYFDQLILQWRTMIRQTILQKRSTLQEGKGKHRRRTKQKNQNGSLTRQIIINLRSVLGK